MHKLEKKSFEFISIENIVDAIPSIKYYLGLAGIFLWFRVLTSFFPKKVPLNFLGRRLGAKIFKNIGNKSWKISYLMKYYVPNWEKNIMS